MNRYYCTHCNRKRNESFMILVRDRITKKLSWICREHASKISDILIDKTNDEKPVFVELFSGSGNISKAARSAGFNTVTVDIEKKYNPDIAIDILNLRRSQLPGSVDVVWCSIPCTVYSILNLANHWEKINLGYREYYYSPKTASALEALKILSKTISLIIKLNPIYYFIENPRGALRHIPHLSFIPYRHTVSYSDYGFEVYKPTDIFTNCKQFKPTKIRTAVNRQFKESIQDLKSSYERSLIPGLLINEVINSIKFLTNQNQSISGDIAKTIYPSAITI